MAEWLLPVFFLVLAGVLGLAFYAGHARGYFRGYFRGYRAGRAVGHERDTSRRCQYSPPPFPTT